MCVYVCVNNHGRKLILVMDRASKKRRNKTAFGPRGQTETSLKMEDLLSNKTTGNFHKSRSEFYIIIFLNKLKMVENTHKKYEKNQNKTSVAKSMGPFRDSQAPFWLTGPRSDVATEPPLIGTGYGGGSYPCNVL